MFISMIAAMAKNRVIGRDNQMPWHLPADLQHFKQTTLGKPILMGRRTYESIGRALPGRRNYVLTRDSHWQAADVTTVGQLQQAIAIEQQHGSSELVIIGGGQLYQRYLPQVKRLYLTLIDLDVDGDTHFPDYQSGDWSISTQTQYYADERNPYNYLFMQLERR
ncbi:type 3 dihydrofolate reductase [Celerinatantimonas yamalensis]|uniref:Dihydrofolate reductase n=1 Tax=Celerinatantimonas yamalensis TaxID=559956 RepID=A0ABW9GAM1_9GAMM